MLGWIIEASLRHRWVVCLLTGVWVVAGASALWRLPVDAFPDTTPVQVQINTVAPGLNPVEVEHQVTQPIELALGGLPGLQNVRSVSRFGLSQVVVTFGDAVPVSLARQVVSERLQAVELPEEVGRPELGPMSTGLGEVLQYVVYSTDPGRSLTDLWEWHEWVLKPELRKVPGVAEINTWGGLAKRYEVVVDPERLLRYGLTLRDVVEALRANNRNVGGGRVDRSGESLLVHGVGVLTCAEQVAGVVMESRGGVPIRVGDVAVVRPGHDIRLGAASADGRGEVVLGLGFVLMGENSAAVTRALKSRLTEVCRNLPPDLRVEVVYDRTELVDHVLRTVRHNLWAGALLVIAVLFALLGNLRAGLIVALAIPLSLLFAGQMMLQAGIAASLLSLGALDFGLIVDSSVVMVENCVRRAAERGDRPWLDQIRDAALEVRKPTMFGELIILIVFLPVLTLEGVEGKLFRPMALTMIFALLGSLVLSLTVMPALASLVLVRGRTPHGDPWPIVRLRRAYEPLLCLALRHRAAVLWAAVILVCAAGWLVTRLGGEFVPRLSEGALAISTVRLAGVSVEEAVAWNRRIERQLQAAFPDEIARVWCRLGTAEVATDPMGIEVTDVFVTLRPREQWRQARTQAELTERIREELARQPGMSATFSQPIEMRVNEMTAGVRSDVAVKIYGDDLVVLGELARQVQSVLARIPGAADVTVEQLTGQPVLEVRVAPEVAGRYGISVQEVLDWVRTIGGLRVGEVREGQRRFPLVVCLPDSHRREVEVLRETPLPTVGGAVIRMGEVAQVVETEGPAAIQREWARRRVTVQVNVQGRDTAGFVDEARRRIAESVVLPPGYTMEWGGRFEHMERARRRLMVVVPVALGLVLGLLYLSLGSVRDVAIVATGIPLGAVGGVAALWLRGMPMTVSAGIGFVALSGVAVLNGLVLVTFIRQLRERGRALEEAVREGCLVRLRPVLMTGLVAALGFVPMALSTGVGAEVQRPLATVVVGGVLTNMTLTLVVLPALYTLWHGRGEVRAGARAVQNGTGG
ncbi:efflux RND transporter permease subunit [Limisphaera ngatamarikiensis]|uniref:Efflux RND transporter permease subunit n=1 Tax=Limisphaera ngatamarikiensis TaxID=1324935 RepID=A0A6M1RYK1_9BACT|nr:CusA/CzcA family heavy metal efflux RND transporter [Limisphaera ngatamarikiensis]NGO40571.1 efflux RND transporter permease subunit [Limisphaera ngatamarikiensis]